MKRCNNCKIIFSQIDDLCPLCHNPSQYEEGEDDYSYPYIPLQFSGSTGIKILLFISVIVAVVMSAIGYLTKTSLKMPLFTIMAILTMWIVLFTIVQKRRNIIKSFLYQMLIFSILFIIWDINTGLRGWAVSFAIPILNISAQIAMLISAKIMREHPSDYLIYFLLACLTGLFPLIFLILDLTTKPLLSVLCVSISIITLSGMMIFYGNILWDEIKKKLSM